MNDCRLLLMGLVMTASAATQLHADEPPGPLRAGIIGLDTSHCVAFTELLNAASPTPDLAGVRVVAAFPGGSPDIPDSRDRVAGYTARMRELGVEIVDSIEALLPLVDVVLVESVDGRPHLAQASAVIRAGKPLFIDKPVAGSLADAVEIYRLAREHHVPCFSSSGLRFSQGIAGMRTDERVGGVIGCEARSPATIEPHHPDLYWYGIHGVETLYTIMGPGCVSVARAHTDGADVVVGVWRDGRIGTFRGVRQGAAEFGATVFGAKAVVQSGGFDGYRPLVAAIVQFFRTGQPPVSAEETLEIYAFMEAADESKRQGGTPVTLESVLAKARKEAAAKNLSAAGK